MRLIHQLRILSRLQQKRNSCNFLNVLDHYLFPALCILCDQPRETDSRWFCIECKKSLNLNITQRDFCTRCGQNRTIRKCSCHISWEYPYERIFSIFDYDEKIQELVRHIKYHGKKSLAFELASFLPYTSELRENFDHIIPIPLHWTRLRKRGYNQAEWFAKGLSAQTDIPLLSSVIKRSRTTGTQTKLDRTERRRNMKNAFTVVETYRGILKDKRILLADDVVTTGATTAACTEALLQAGCKGVQIISIARD